MTSSEAEPPDVPSPGPDGPGDGLPGLAELARQLQKVRETLAHQVVVQAAQRSQIARLGDRLDNAGVDTLADRFEELAATVQAVLDAAAPRGPAAPRWDEGGTAQRAAQLAALREWVEKVLRPGYVTGGCYRLADCWDRHEIALWELGTVAVWWRFVYARARPDTGMALEFNDRWLPGAMRRVGEATRHCNMGHSEEGL